MIIARRYFPINSNPSLYFSQLLLIIILGYRDAQLSWLQVQEPTSKMKHKSEPAFKRSALFLAIYGPRRGVLEVWSIQQGDRVAAFNVSKGSRYVTHLYWKKDSQIFLTP